MKSHWLKQLPQVAAGTVIAVACLLQWRQPRPVQSLEASLYDWRVRLAHRFPEPAATNLGFVFMNDESIAHLDNPAYPLHCGLYWPRHIYGRVLQELSAQGAKAVALDVLFTGLRPDHAPVVVRGTAVADAMRFLSNAEPTHAITRLPDGILMESDDYLAWQLRQTGIGILGADKDALPAPLFATNAPAIGDVSAERDHDGVLRRAWPWHIYRRWHPLFRQAASEFGIDLRQADIQTNAIVLQAADGTTNRVPLDAQGDFALKDFVGDALPPGWPLRAKPFTDERIWHTGLLLAAAELGMDLNHSQFDPTRHTLTLRATNGLQRVIPLEDDGSFLIDWSLSVTDPRLIRQPIHVVLDQHLARAAGHTSDLPDPWRGCLAVVGSSATGNDLTDRGATPLEKDTLLASEHWNIANSIIAGRFIQRSPPAINLALIVALGALTASLTWRLPALAAALAVLVLASAYTAVAAVLFVRWRIWTPMVLPVGVAIVVQHVSLVTYRVVIEEREKRRVRAFFAKVVSPDIVQELLSAEKLAFGGAHREVTVMFADVRGFTELTDRNREAAERHLREHSLDAAAATAYLDRQARETLNTVNCYLATVADAVKQHAGTLDKYIGDCVMAFWGAPTPNPRHALCAVQAAVAAQRAIAALNRQREEENRARAAAGQPPLPVLTLGSGINTGSVVVGLMGSDAHILNYTVFGREVNLASRLESVSGRGRIVIGAATFEHLQRDDPALAARCVRLEPTTVKGIHTAVVCYEVPWRLPETPALSP